MFKLMSFNIRNPCDQGLQAWPNRRDLIFARIEAAAPDLIGFQEVLGDQYTDITARLNGYAFFGEPREQGDRPGERALIGYRPERFERLQSGHFWLSTTPDIPGSRSWDSVCVRICTWVKLHDLQTDKKFLFANTHWDHEGLIARQESAQLCKQKLTALSDGGPALLTGDFNSIEDDPWMHSLQTPAEGEIQLIDSYREIHPIRQADEASFNGFTGIVAGSRIDFIFHTPEFVTRAADIDRVEAKHGRFPSDHYAVTATLEWRTE